MDTDNADEITLGPTQGWPIPLLELYEGNNATQDLVASYNPTKRFSGRVRPNDEARSMRMFAVPIGTTISLYDAGNGGTRDDWCEIRVKQRVKDYIVDTFERSYEDNVVRVVYHEKDNLDGKVSYIRIEPPRK
jgi:hypothetical protein